jgi:hypothetical protein
MDCSSALVIGIHVAGNSKASNVPSMALTSSVYYQTLCMADSAAAGTADMSMVGLFCMASATYTSPIATTVYVTFHSVHDSDIKEENVVSLLRATRTVMRAGVARTWTAL